MSRFMLCSAPAIGGEPVKILLDEGEGKAEAEAKFRKMVNGLKAAVLIVDPEEKPVVEDGGETSAELLAALEKVDELQSELNEAIRENKTLTEKLETAESENKTLTEKLEDAQTNPGSSDDDMM